MKAYKFLRNNMRSGSGDEPAWNIGEKRNIKGQLELCSRGYHSSPSWYDALSYAYGNMACIVEVSRPIYKDKTKQVSHSCQIVLCVDAKKVLRTWACDCAERALKVANAIDERSWNAIKVARLFNEGKATAEELAAAWDAAGAARAAAWDAAGAAAWAAAGDAAGAAAGDAAWAAAGDAAGAAAGDAARAAAWDAAWDEAAWDAAWDAEVEWQKQHLDELMESAFKVGL